MASKLVGVLDLQSQQISIERTDVGGPSGPHVIALDDGAWFASDRGIGVAKAGATSTTVQFNDPHSFAIGDVLWAWDVGGLDTGAADLAGRLFVDTVTAVPAADQVTFGSSHTWAIDDHFFVKDDLVGYLVSRFRAQDYASFKEDFGASVTSGIFSFAATAGQVYEVVWTTTWLRDVLRYSGTVTVTGASEIPNPDRQMEGYLYLEKEIQRDKLVLEPRASQSRSVTGQIETLYRTALRTRAIRIRTEGPPRSTLKTTYQAAEDLWSSHFAQGKRWRCHVDASVETPWVLFTNPRGYEVFVHLGPSRWDPDLLARGYDNYLDATIPAQVYVP
jgi:hypothetical protein